MTADLVQASPRRLRAPAEVVVAGRIVGRPPPAQQVAVWVKREQTAHEAATGFELSRAILCSGPAVFPRPQERKKCESSLFSVRLVQASSEIITRKVCSGKGQLSRVK